jgi:hypothetical protein
MHGLFGTQLLFVMLSLLFPHQFYFAVPFWTTFLASPQPQTLWVPWSTIGCFESLYVSTRALLELQEN